MKPLKVLALVFSLIFIGSSFAQANRITDGAMITPQNTSGGGGIPIDLGTS